jgi:acyl-CoA oxidase
MQLVAKNRLSEFRKSFGKMDAMGIINVYMKMLKRLFLKRTDCNQKTDESHLIDQTHLLAFQHRENNFSICSTKRIKKLIDSGLDPYDAFNIVQHQMIDVAQLI